MAKSNTNKKNDKPAKKQSNKAVSKKQTGKVVKKRKFGRYFKEVYAELKKVTWPSRKELTNYSVAVIVVLIILAAVIGVIDLGLGKLFNFLVNL